MEGPPCHFSGGIIDFALSFCSLPNESLGLIMD